MSMQDLLHQRKRMLGFYAFSFAAISGALSVTTTESDVADAVLTVTIAAVSVLFCVTDARCRGREIPPLSRWLLLIVWPIGVPGYLLLCRGKAGAAYGLLALVGFAGLFYLAMGMVWGYYLLWWRTQSPPVQ